MLVVKLRHIVVSVVTGIYYNKDGSGLRLDAKRRTHILLITMVRGSRECCTAFRSANAPSRPSLPDSPPTSIKTTSKP